MISMARTLGAPDTVPAGSVARRTSMGVRPSASFPDTCEVRCITWLYRSRVIISSTCSVPNSTTRPTSLRARSISITCSATSLGCSASSAPRRRSSSSVAPRGRVPAMGRDTTRPSSSCTIGSGDEPTRVTSGWRRKYMYGLGFTWRSTRYTSKGSAFSSRSKRWASTTWKMSPARMCSLATSTAAQYISAPIVEVTSGSGSLGSGGSTRGSPSGRAPSSASCSRRATAAS